MAKSIQHIEALRLRREGKSLKDIAGTLQVSKGTASVWCKDIVLNLKQIELLHEKMVRGGYAGRLKGANVQKAQKQEKIHHYVDQGRKEIPALNKRELFFVGLGLYWGEGGKTNSAVRFYNSNPLLIKFVMRWFREVMEVSEERFYMNVTINKTHRARLDEVISYWSEITNIPICQFRKPILIKAKSEKLYENHFEHYGTLCIRITKSSDLFYRIMGLIKALSTTG